MLLTSVLTMPWFVVGSIPAMARVTHSEIATFFVTLETLISGLNVGLSAKRDSE
jgi:hypothetical protein